MKMFTKLALVSSMAVSANAMAMQSMDDAALSATTGQDGINIGIGISKIEIAKVLVHDNDGLRYNNASWTGGVPTTPVAAVAGSPAVLYTQAEEDAAELANPGQTAIIAGGIKTPAVTAVAAVPAGLGYGGTTGSTAARAGAIVIKGNGTSGDVNENHGIVISANSAALLPSHNLADIVIDTEAGAGGGNTAFLNVAAKVSGLNIAIGEIGVSASNAVGTTVRRGADEANNYNAILSGLTLTTGQMTANVQLGAAPQGAMIKLDSTMTGGLTISNLGILDSSTIGTQHYNAAGNLITTTTAGEIRIGSIKLANANGSDLTVQADISVVGEAVAGNNTGYLQINTMKTATDAYVAGVRLGSATAGSIGDIEVQGLNVYNGATGTTPGAIIKISGH